MLCKNCEHLKILYEPLKDKGVMWDLGRATCTKHDLITDFANHTKLNKLKCWEEEKNDGN